MFLAADEHEAEIAASAADFLADLMPIRRLHCGGSADLSPGLRRKVGAMGWFGLALSEKLGGSGLSAVEHVLFFQAAGRNCAPVDLLAQGLGAILAEEDTALLGEILSGEKGVALAVQQDDDLRIFGHPTAVLAVAATPDGARLLDIAALQAETRPSLDPATTIRIAAAAPAICVGMTSDPNVWRMAQLGVAAMLVGLAEVALELIVEYAKVRETFGRKIGSYQAVRHPAADMALRLEAARAQLWYAAAALKEGKADVQAHIDAAKHLANVAAVANADWNIQLHGGIGITDEHDAHLLLKHALLLTRLFGTKRALLARLLHARLED
jgi:alkylation response protein AidB-like acyl-CoA dehydrogenase